MNWINWHRFLEFFIVGVLLGVVEDMIAIFLATDTQFNWRIVIIAFFVALPFAIFSELIVDHEKFKGFMRKKFNKNP